MPLKCTRTFLGVALLASVISIALGHHAGLSDRAVAKVKEEFGATAEQRLYSWQSLIHDHMDENDQAKLEAVNDFFNRARFVDDIKLWRQKDYWATPVEFLARNAGDCEDFSIAKFFTLKDMGMDTAKLRITYVKALRLNQAHMVLAYYPTPSSVPLILDNLTGRILPADQRTDLRPVYSFNAEDLWLSRSRNEQVKAGKASSLGRWMELNRRFNLENLPVKETVPSSNAEKKRPDYQPSDKTVRFLPDSYTVANETDRSTVPQNVLSDNPAATRIKPVRLLCTAQEKTGLGLALNLPNYICRTKYRDRSLDYLVSGELKKKATH